MLCADAPAAAARVLWGNLYESKFGSPGTGNGQFNEPWMMAINPVDGTVYVGDRQNKTVQKFDASGNFISKFGGAGSGPGQFGDPVGVAVDPASGDVYVADYGNNRVEKFDSSGKYLSQFGSTGSGAGQFSSPYGVAVDPTNGDVYVADYGNNRVEKFDSSGRYLSQFGSSGSGAGQFSFPTGIAVDPSSGSVYVADTGNLRVEKFNSTSAYVLQFGSSSQFSDNVGVAVDPTDGSVYVSDSNTYLVTRFSSTGTYMSAFGGNSGGSGADNGQLISPVGVAVRPLDAGVDVVDSYDNRVEEYSAGGGYLSQTGAPGAGNGQFNTPFGLSIDQSNGIFYVADYHNDRVEKFDALGAYLSQFGSSGSGPGQFNSPSWVAVDPNDRSVFVVDSANNRVEKFDANGNFVTSFGSFGTGNGQFNVPLGVAVDAFNHWVYVSDYLNDRVEKFAADGLNPGQYISQFGTPGSGAGQFNNPAGLAVDPSDSSVYVADLSNDRVEKFNSSGTYVSQLGTTGAADAFFGDFNHPEAVAVDSNDGGVYVSDTSNNRVERFDANGVFQAEFGSLGSGNDQFSGPEGIDVSGANGTTYVVDQAHNRVERFGAPAPPSCAAQSATTREGVAVRITLTCSGPAGVTPTFGIVSNPTHGTVSGFNPFKGQLMYTPAAGYSGGDSFTFHAGADGGTSQTQTLSISVNPPPSCQAVNVVTTTGVPSTIQLSCGDPAGATVTYALDSQPSHGSLGQVDQGSGQVLYTPAAGYRGSDSFSYHATSANGTAASKTVSITVKPLPTCQPASVVTLAGHTKVVQLACVDPTGAPVTYVLDRRPAHGSLGSVNQANGHVTYKPAAGYVGGDTFTYHATSGNGTAAPNTVSITVNPLGQITSSLTWAFSPRGSSVSVRSLIGKKLQLGASVLVLCKGRGCPFSRRTTVVRAPRCKRHKRCRPPHAQTVNLTSEFHGHRLAFGDLLTVRFVKPGWIGKVYTFKISTSVATAINCLAPGGIVPGKDC